MFLKLTHFPSIYLFILQAGKASPLMTTSYCYVTKDPKIPSTDEFSTN